jgi:hypothetical protein
MNPIDAQTKRNVTVISLGLLSASLIGTRRLNLNPTGSRPRYFRVVLVISEVAMQVAKMGNSLAIRLRGRRLLNYMNFDAVISATDRDDRKLTALAI